VQWRATVTVGMRPAAFGCPPFSTCDPLLHSFNCSRAGIFCRRSRGQEQGRRSRALYSIVSARGESHSVVSVAARLVRPSVITHSRWRERPKLPGAKRTCLAGENLLQPAAAKIGAPPRSKFRGMLIFRPSPRPKQLPPSWSEAPARAERVGRQRVDRARSYRVRRMHEPEAHVSSPSWLAPCSGAFTDLGFSL
jgi:hypothetical protein